MITLNDYIRESLLDDEEDLINRADNDIANDIINNPTSEFRKEYKTGEGFHDFGEITDKPLKIENNKLIIENTKFSIGNYKEIHPLKDYINVDEIYSDHIINVYSEELSKNKVCKKISASILSCNCDIIKDIDLNITTGDFYKNSQFIPTIEMGFSAIFSTAWSMHYKDKQLIFKNVNLNTNKHRILMHTSINPDISGLKTDAKEIYIYDPSMFSDKYYFNLFDSLLDTSYSTTTGINNEFIRKGNTKTTLATLNNLKKYKTRSPLIKARIGAKLSDILDTKGLKNIESITYTDDTMSRNPKSVKFIKNGKKSMFNDRFAEVELEDGWLMKISGNK